MSVYQPLNPGQVIENLDINELEMVSINGTSYVGNMEYNISRYFDWDVSYQAVDLLSLTRIHNPEGYVTTLKTSTGTGPIYHYYRRDHLGNNREVWRAEYLWSNNTVPASTAQRTQYYPSGLSWKFNTDDGASTQPYKYNGKEFVEAHGLDEYDYGARGMYPAIMRFTTMDPLAEKYYSISPYVYVANNPVKYIDPDGRKIVLPKGTSIENTYTVLGNLQKLTDDRLVYSTQKDGNIRIKVASLGKGNKISGTNLIRDLNSSERTVTISIGEAGSGNNESHLRANSTNGVGTDSEVNFDPTVNPSIPTKDPKTGNVSEAKRPNQIGLGHELIHAIRAMTGTSANGTTTQTYKDANGNTVTKSVRREEVETIGIQGNHKYNENKLRKEQGLNERGAY